LVTPRISKNIIEPEMVKIPAGKSRMGSSKKQILQAINSWFGQILGRNKKMR